MDINEKIELYMDEGTKLDVYRAMLNSVSAAIKVIDVAMKENKGAANLTYLRNARKSLGDAQSELRKVPLEVFKNIAISAIQKVTKFLMGW